MSYKAEIQTEDKGDWYGNTLRFPTEGQAQAWVDDLYRRWATVKATRVKKSRDRATHAYIEGRAIVL
jgi:hypothetical protein